MANRALSILALLICASIAAAQVRITLEATVEHQTITGWEATAWVADPSDPAFPYYKDTLYDLLVNEIGIDRVRLEIRSGVENNNSNWANYRAGIINYQTWRSRRYATVNDNSDPSSINWALPASIGQDFISPKWTIRWTLLSRRSDS
jgi:O-glycosyl hydrolase